MLNGDAHYSAVKVRTEPRIRPLPKFSKTGTAARIAQAMPLTINDEVDHPTRADGPRFRVIVLPPASVERLIGRLIGRLLRWVGGARG